jgi:hypothetical protein
LGGRRRRRRSRRREERRRRRPRGREHEGWRGRRQGILFLRVIVATASAIVDTRALPRHSSRPEGCVEGGGQGGAQEQLEAVLVVGLVVFGGSTRIFGIGSRERTSFLGNDIRSRRCAGRRRKRKQ